MLERNRSCLPVVESPITSSAISSPEKPQQESREPSDQVHPQEGEAFSTQEHVSGQSDGISAAQPLTISQQRRQLNRDKRYALYEQVKDLRKRGLSHYVIADTLGMSRPTIRRFLEAEQFPERVEKVKAKPKNSVVAPYLSFLRERWGAGCHNGRQLFREAKARGYSGS
jgi:hypothetical protein